VLGTIFEIPPRNSNITVKWFVENMGGGFALDSSGLRKGQLAGSCENCNKVSVSVRGGKFLEQLRIFLVLAEWFCSMRLVS
jgi:hypothetical protein